MPVVTSLHAKLLYPGHENTSPLFEIQTIKDQMDKKFGAPWHVVVGQAFSYEITTEVGS